MRIVLDTNILLVSIPKQSKYRPIFDALIEKKFTLLISNEILTEYEEIFSQKTNQAVSHNIVKMLLTLTNVEKIEIHFNWNLIKVDKDDNKFVDCSIAGNAHYLVSNDKHFDGLKTIEFPEVPLLKVEEFLQLIE